MESLLEQRAPVPPMAGVLIPTYFREQIDRTRETRQSIGVSSRPYQKNRRKKKKELKETGLDGNVICAPIESAVGRATAIACHLVVTKITTHIFFFAAESREWCQQDNEFISISKRTTGIDEMPLVGGYKSVDNINK